MLSLDVPCPHAGSVYGECVHNECIRCRVGARSEAGKNEEGLRRLICHARGGRSIFSSCLIDEGRVLYVFVLFFQYHFGIIPHRRPIKVVFGSPITLPKQTKDGRSIADLGESWLCVSDEGKRIVAEAHARYVQELERLHHEHQSSFFPGEPVPLELN